MKLIRINSDGTMNDISIDTKLSNRNIVKHLSKQSLSKGDGEMNELYRWKVDSNYDLLCFGWYDGQAGFENKHDLPPSGISKIIDEDDSSDKKLLFGDIFIALSKNETFVDIDVSAYANYYEVLFEGFDDCNTSDDDISDEEELEDSEFINDDDDYDINEESDDSDYDNSIEELDEDDNEYTDEESDYDSACEGEDDSE